MTRISFFGGINEIGGNKILIEDEGTHVFLDFGKSFGRWARFFEEYLKPTTSRGIEQFWELGLLPEIEGIYRKDLLEFAGHAQHKQPSVDAVFLSHAHQDHSSYISFLDEQIPIFCSPVTKTVIQSIESVGNRNLEGEIIDYKFRPASKENSKKPVVKRDIKTIEGKFKLDSIEVELLPVDHSIPGACAMIIHCSNGTIAYSGDLRLHGTFGKMTEIFAEKAGEYEPDVFLCEGTRIKSEENFGEDYVKTQSTLAVKNSKNLVTVDYSWKDTTRFLTLYEVAKDTGRQLLIPFRTAYYLRELKPVFSQLPNITDENILLFEEKRESGTYEETDYNKWQKEFLGLKNTVKSEYVSKHQSEIIACLGYYDMLDLMDIVPKQTSSYIHSSSEPYNEEMEIDEKRCDNWIELLGLKTHQIHASGHAPRNDLFKVATMVNAKKLIPIHTEHPEEFYKTKLNVLTVKTKDVIEL